MKQAKPKRDRIVQRLVDEMVAKQEAQEMFERLNQKRLHGGAAVGYACSMAIETMRLAERIRGGK